MIEMIKVTEVRALDGRRLWLHFSNGREGVRDFSDNLADRRRGVAPSGARKPRGSSLPSFTVIAVLESNASEKDGLCYPPRFTARD